MINLKELADRLTGTLQGNDAVVYDICTPENQKEGAVCILSDQKKEHFMTGSASAYVVPESFEAKTAKPLIRIKNIREALVAMLDIFRPEKPVAYSISPKASIAKDAVIAADVYIGDFAVIGNNVSVGAQTIIHPNVTIGDRVSIGKGCVLHPGVTIYPGCVLKDNVILHAGTVIGADGFGYIPGANHTKIPHRGIVIIHSNVEIGANCTIDRGVIDATEIKEGTKLDNMVHVAHNVIIGKGCLIAAQCGISGSTELGDYIMCGGQVGIADHVQIASFVNIAAQSGIPKSIKEKGTYGGYPISPINEWAKQVASVSALPELRRRVTALEKIIKKDEQ